MSDVIRNAVIKLAIQLQSPDMKIPGIDAAIKQQQALAQATEKANAVNAAATKAQADAARGVELKARTAAIEAQQAREAAAEAAKATQIAFDEAKAKLDAAFAAQQKTEAAEREARVNMNVAMSTARVEAAYMRAGAAALNMGRGLAFIAAGSSEALDKALPMVFAVEGAARVAQSGATMHAALAAAYKAEAAAAATATVATSRLAVAGKVLAAVLSPVVVAAGAVYVVYNRLNAVYRHFVPTQDEVNKRLREEFEARERANQALEDAESRYNIIVDAQLEHIDLLASETQKQQALLALMSDPTNPADKQLQAGRQVLQILDKQRQAIAEQKREAIELVKTRERDLKTAREALKAEQDRDQSLRAAVGALNVGEKKRLAKLTSKVEAGGSLTQKEAIDLQKLGGDAGQKLGEKFLATMDGGLGARLEKLVGDPLRKAQEEYERRQQSFNKTTGGRSSDQAVTALNSLDETIAKTVKAVEETVTAKMGEFIDAVREQKLNQSRQQSAQRAARAALDGK